MVNHDSTVAIERLQIPLDEIVQRSGGARKLAWVLGTLLVALPVLLVLVPWQQNVPGTGRMTALDPLDRIQVIPAPVSGRLTQLNVREGTRVVKGQELAVMEDLDPDFAARLDQQVGFAQDKLEFSHTTLETLDAQLISLQSSRAAALRSARADFDQAT